MTNRPIPRRGLLGCWFLDDRGITYDSGANEAIDRSGKGNHATYQNGVTVGVEGDPSREFGAADFDSSSSQYAPLNSPLGIGDNQAVVSLFKPTTANFSYIIGNIGPIVDGGVGLRYTSSQEVEFAIGNSSGNLTTVRSDANLDEFHTVVGAVSSPELSLYHDGGLADRQTVSSNDISVGADDRAIASRNGTGQDFFDGVIAATAIYDLTAPNAPEPSEIARRWDRLTDIPATR